MAKDDKSLLEMLQYLINSLNLNKDSEIMVITYFRTAFPKAGIKKMKLLGGWDFFNRGSLSIEEIERELKPLIDKEVKEL